MKCGSPFKFLENWDKKITKIVDEMIESQTRPTFLIMSEQDKAFLKSIFLEGYKMGKEGK